MEQPTVAVIIAAYNAADTIPRSVASALAQDAVTEVIVVDDCSTDDTAAVALAAAEGDQRLKVLSQPRNMGPAAARNRAIEASSAAIIAILDADDIFLNGRLAPMLSLSDWDLCADNILFVTSEDDLPVASLPPSPPECPAVPIDTARFVAGNISSSGNYRGELGFLKPLIRRDVLTRLRVRYAEQCRLGEDFLLYFELLARGARFRLLPECGYAGLVRLNSLSNKHDLDALEALYEESIRLQRRLLLPRDVRKILERHNAQLRRKITHRQALAIRQNAGLMRGIAFAARYPTAAFDVLRDRLRTSGAGTSATKRLLSDQDYRRLQERSA